MENRIITVDQSNIELLEEFIDNLGESRKSFRYFNNRTLASLTSHIVTYLCITDGVAIGYGHLDRDNDIVWLGVAVLPNSWRKGIGTLLVNELLKAAKQFNLGEVFLSVDRDNLKALNLYYKLGFEEVDGFSIPHATKLRKQIN